MCKKVLISGARSKFVSPLVKQLLGDGCEIALLTKSPDLVFTEPEVQIFEVDLCYEFEINFVPDVVIHLAAKVPYNRSTNVPTDQADLIVSNTRMIVNILNFARNNNVSKFIYLSSTDVYPFYVDEVITELTNVRPNSVYGCSKLACERIALTYKNLFDLDIVILRLGPVYGDGLDSSLKIYKMLDAVKKGQSISLYNSKNILSLLEVNRASSAIYKAIKSNPGIYNIAGSPDCLDDFFKKKYIEYGYKPNINYHGNQEPCVRMIFDLSKAATDLGWGL